MDINNHGVWERYTPSVLPAGVPVNVLFSQRTTDQVDWYAYNNDASNWTANSVKMVLFPHGTTPGGATWVVGQANRDPTILFPQSGLILEVTDDVGTGDPSQYLNKLYTVSSDGTVQVI